MSEYYTRRAPPPHFQEKLDNITLAILDRGRKVLTDKTLEETMEEFKNFQYNDIYCLDTPPMDEMDFGYGKKDLPHDPILVNFAKGCNAKLAYTIEYSLKTDMTPIVIRGLGKKVFIVDSWRKNRPFYYIDTGYFGNGRKKIFHRVAKNHLQTLTEIVPRDNDRLKLTGVGPTKFRRKGSKILICPPSQKVMNVFSLDVNTWVEETVSTIKQYTDREIVIRLKPKRDDRVSTNPIEKDFEDAFCLVTFNSIAATEALIYGIPAFTLGPNAAHWLCETNLGKIEQPKYPSTEEVRALLCHLSYCQFTEDEMADGTAWRLLHD